MEVISHRGFWQNHKEKNGPTAFLRSFELGFGTETDLRDLDGKVVISHDMPHRKDKLMQFKDLLALYNQTNCKGTLALNIKADGLQKEIKKTIDFFSIENYVLFDMSIPDMVVTKNYGLKFLSRLSNIEPYATLISDADGVWLDEFESGWLKPDYLEYVLNFKKRVFVVSPELHGRNSTDHWHLLKSYVRENIILCTDYPQRAKEFFGV